MRLYLKLFTAVLLAAATQACIDGTGGWLDERVFEIRVSAACALGVPPQSPALIDAAERLKARQLARLGIPPVVAAVPAHPAPAPLLASYNGVSTVPRPATRLYARAG
jgi:hypothetical protein